MKHISPKFFYIHKLQKNGDINVQQIRLSDNVTDLFTKSPPIATFKKIVHKIGMEKFIVVLIRRSKYALFVDILHEAPLSGHRKPTSLIGSIFQQYLVYQVKKIRLQGYYIFSQKLKHIIRLPFATIAYGTAAMLLVMVWDPHISILSMPTLLRIIMLMEVVCVSSFMTLYIGCVHQYNSLDSQPDVLKSLYSPLQPSSSLEGLRILRLQETLSKYERSNDGSAPQVDLAHLLETRDQELRTLKAEMNQLQSELWLARSIIEEKDAEIQRIRNANNQYVEENERLGAILGEWSNRAAKLERALELERMSNLELQKKMTTLKTQTRE
ncbi:hypothetical protein P3L10_014100 [Capsicum annuum]